MIKFFNNLEDEEKFMAIVNCVKSIKDIHYEGFDTSDPLDEMNDFLDIVNGHLLYTETSINVYCWFQEIYDRWTDDCSCELSVETINKSFEAALSGKWYYDAGNFLDGWDLNLVEYVLKNKEDFVIINDKDDYKKFLYKYDVTVECPSGYYMDTIDLWRRCDLIKEDVTDSMKNSVMNDFYENDNGDYEDDDGNVINVEEEAAAYADCWLSELNYEDAVITRGENSIFEL